MQLPELDWTTGVPFEIYPQKLKASHSKSFEARGEEVDIAGDDCSNTVILSSCIGMASGGAPTNH